MSKERSNKPTSATTEGLYNQDGEEYQMLKKVCTDCADYNNHEGFP